MSEHGDYDDYYDEECMDQYSYSYEDYLDSCASTEFHEYAERKFANTKPSYSWYWCFIMDDGYKPVIDTLWIDAAKPEVANGRTVIVICPEYKKPDYTHRRQLWFTDPFTVAEGKKVVFTVTDETLIAKITEACINNSPVTQILPF